MSAEAREVGAREIAEGAVRLLVDYAYEHGFHEMGYDPVAALIEATQEAERAALSPSADGETELWLDALEASEFDSPDWEHNKRGLLAHVAALRRNREEWKDQALAGNDILADETKRREALEAELAALRPGTTGEGDESALRGAIDFLERHVESGQTCCDDCGRVASERAEAVRSLAARVAQLQARAAAAERVARVESDLARQAVADLDGLRAEVARLTDALRGAVGSLRGFRPMADPDSPLAESLDRAEAALQGGTP